MLRSEDPRQEIKMSEFVLLLKGLLPIYLDDLCNEMKYMPSDVHSCRQY